MKRKLTKLTKELRDTNPIVTFEAQINQTDEGAHGYQFSSLLLKPKSNQTDEGAQGHQFSSLLLKRKLTKPTKELRDTNSLRYF